MSKNAGREGTDWFIHDEATKTMVAAVGDRSYSKGSLYME
jgi:hypothetical protein